MLPRLAPDDLVAVLLAPGPVWRDVVRSVWESAAALLPVDHRLSPSEREALLARARPTVVVDDEGVWRIEGGLPAEPDIALAVATSGTGGEPKVAELTRSAVTAAVEASAAALGAEPSEGWLCCLPPAHVGGLLVILRAVLLGSPVAVHARFDPRAFEAEPDLAFVSVVPTMLARLLDARVDLRRFRAILVGGAALSEDLAARAAGAGARLVPTYGLTESCGGVVYDGEPLTGTEVRIGDDGEIVLRGPTVMRGYRLDPAATTAAFDAERWLRTGDAGSFDGGGLHVDGRIDEAILTGGERVWPTEVEAALRPHPGVGDVAVAGRPDHEWGERVVAFIVPADPNRPPGIEDLRGFAAGRLAGYKGPREVVLVDRLPRTRSGKVMRRLLEK